MSLARKVWSHKYDDMGKLKYGKGTFSLWSKEMSTTGLLSDSSKKLAGDRKFVVLDDWISWSNYQVIIDGSSVLQGWIFLLLAIKPLNRVLTEEMRQILSLLNSPLFKL